MTKGLLVCLVTCFHFLLGISCVTRHRMPGDTLFGVAYNSGMYVAAAKTLCVKSRDGVHWRSYQAAFPEYGCGLKAAQNKTFIIGSREILVSTDLEYWQKSRYGDYHGECGICPGPDSADSCTQGDTSPRLAYSADTGYVLAGNRCLWVSADAVTWRQVNISPYSMVTSVLDDGRGLLVTTPNDILRMANDASLEPVCTTSQISLARLFYVMGHYFSADLSKSNDLVQWEHTAFPFSPVCASSMASNGHNIVVCDSIGRGIQSNLYVSTDLSSWREVTLRPSNKRPFFFRDVIAGPSGYVAVGRGSAIAFSPDGQAWRITHMGESTITSNLPSFGGPFGF